MKRFFKVRLLPICLLLVMLLQTLPVLAQRETVYHLGMRHAAESKTYGTVTPDFSVSYLYYDQLETDAQRTIYNALAEAKPGDNIIALEVTDIPTFIVPSQGATAAFQAEIMAYVESQVLPAYAAATLDNPLMFWASGVQYGANLSVMGNTVSSITIQCLPDASGNYDRAGYEAAVDALWDVYYGLSIPEENTYLQLKYFHDYLCETVVYVESKNSHNVTGPLLEGKSVCEGYAKSLKLFCQVMDIPCVTITGVGYGSNGFEAHAWNAVRMEDGKWYAVDVTWDDQTSGIFYDFFLVGGDSVPEYFEAIPFNQSHVAMGDFYGTGQVVMELPALNPTAYVPPAVHAHEYVAEVTPATCTKYGFTTYTCSCGDSYVGDYTALAEHAYTETVHLPTCEEEGYTAYLCTECGHTSIDDVTPALGHQYDGGVVIVEPTEETEGEVLYTCSACGDTYVEILPILEHTHKYITEIILPSCTEEGYTIYTCKCGENYKDHYVEALGHSYDNGVTTAEPTEETEGEIRYTCENCGDFYVEALPKLEHTHKYTAEVTPPTCIEEGYTTYTCKCGDSYQDHYTQTVDHDYTDWVVEVPATCHGSGILVRKCRVCGLEDKIFSTPGEAVYEAVVTPPTCEKGGYTTYYCTTCDEYYVDDYTDPTGHSYDAEVTPPTCLEDGYTTYTCASCGDSYTGDVVLSVGHSFEEAVTPPTCTEEGYITYTCASCGESYTDNYVEPTGHAWDNGVVTVEPTEETEGKQIFTCKVCGETNTVILPTLAHTHKHEAVVTPPTCEKEGFTTYTCKCGDSFIGETVPALGHSFEESTIPPTCTEEGALLFTCKNCGRVDSKVLPPTGHSYEVAYTEPTCTEKGYATYTCENCGESYTDNYVDPTGHAFALTSAVEPTCEKGGVYTFECSGCGLTYTEALPPNGHFYTEEVTPPTCEEDGYTTYTCENCGESYTDDPVPALGHSFGDWKEVAPGKEAHTCTACGKTESRDKTPVYDINGDGAVEESDARDLLSLLVGNSTAEALPDMDFDGKLTIYDCVLLMQQVK